MQPAASLCSSDLSSFLCNQALLALCVLPYAWEIAFAYTTNLCSLTQLRLGAFWLLQVLHPNGGEPVNS